MLAIAALAASARPQQTASQPQVRINYLNVCSPSAQEQSEITAALARIPEHPHFAEDFEVARGRSTVSAADLMQSDLKLQGIESETAGAAPSNWVRLRRDFTSASPYLSVQYSVSVDAKKITENLVLRSREAKGVIETSLEDSLSAPATTPAQALAASTPVSRIRLERFGKSSIVLARCAGAAQSQYEPLFSKASTIMAAYRQALAVRSTVPADLRRLGVGVAAARSRSK